MLELLQKIRQNNDQQAFKQLYLMLFFRLYQFAYSFIQSRESSEELVNDVFLALWQKRDTLDQIDNLSVYLYVAIKNASLNLLRKNKVPLPVSIDALKVDHLHLGSDPESLLITREMRERITKAVDSLPARCKLIFKLVKEDGLTYKEVAAILEISVKTVDAQLYVALKKLSQSLLPLWVEYHPDKKPGTTPAR